jgi:N-acyl-D-amino-acid deacylase
MKRASIACLALLLACGGEGVTPPVTEPVTSAPEIPITGTAVAGMGVFEGSVRDIMKKYGLPGGAIAVVYDGRLIYARGFGYSDVENKTPVQPDALFRIASMSKSLTSVGIMKLVEDGKLTLDDRVAPLIAHLTPAPGATVDPRWEQVTIRNLLNHTGGWDRQKTGGFDPMDRPVTAASAVGAPIPASAETVIRYMKGMPFDFNPGEKFVYSNFGYTILGRVIERLSGMPYETFVRTRVLQPAGANRTREGKSRLGDALVGEVKYYMAGSGLVNSPMVPSVFPGEGVVPLNYGGYYLEAKDAEGAWVSSTVDLLRFITRIDGRPSPQDILSPQLITQMTGSGVTTCSDGTCYYSAGWWVRPTQTDATWWHGGDLPGTKSFMVRSSTNVSWVALFNAGTTANVPGELDTALWNALGKMTSYPTTDLFPSFP